MRVRRPARTSVSGWEVGERMSAGGATCPTDKHKGNDMGSILTVDAAFKEGMRLTREAGLPVKGNDMTAPKRIPDGQTVSYKGYTLAKYEGVQMGHTTNAGLRASLGIGTKRKVSGVSVTDAEGYERLFDTLRDAVAWVDRQD